MMLLMLLLVFAGVTALFWFQGLWSNAVNFVNLLIAALLSFSLFELITGKLDEQSSMKSYSYLTDFIVVWLLFAIIFSVLRLFTDFMSRTRVRFPPLFETIGRSVLAAINGYLVVMFVCATLHFAPLAAEPFKGAWPPSMLGCADRQFFQLVSVVSRGSLQGKGFDAAGFESTMRRRRAEFEELEGFRANR